MTGMNVKIFFENTIKIIYDSDNIVVSISNDVSTLWPMGLSVAEIDTLPDDVDIDGNWIFDGENLLLNVYILIRRFTNHGGIKTH